MLSQKETIMLTKALGFSVTDQTLRNYIRAGLVRGAYGVQGGIPGKGIATMYPMETTLEAVVAKDMLTKNARKLVSAQVALARRLGIACLADESFDPLDMYMVLKFVDDDSDAEIIDSPVGRFDCASIKTANVIMSVEQLLSLAAEWIIKIASAERAVLDINRTYLLAGKECPITSCDKVEICGKASYFAVRDEYGYGFAENAADVQDAVLVAEKNWEFRDRHIKASFSYKN